jgi:hypothetical protein
VKGMAGLNAHPPKGPAGAWAWGGPAPAWSM